MHEVLTLQFGQRASYVATHFWNLQESYFTYTPTTEPSIVDHDIHFRAGIGIDGNDTYTPRTLIYDLKGGFGSLRKLNALYDDSTASDVQNAALWQFPAVHQKLQPIPQASYQQNLDQGLPTSQIRKRDIRFWSDFNRVFYHPRSIIQLSEYSLNSSIAPFESWSIGQELWTDVDRDADLLDRDVRVFAEESDQMQGFQIFTGADDAWGGWCSKYTDALRDEFGKKSIWVWGLEDAKRIEQSKMILKAANSSRTLQSVGGLASAYMRLANGASRLPGYMQLDVNNEWESSAVAATAIDSVTLPTRLRGGMGSRQTKYAEIEQFLNTNGGQNIFNLGISAREQKNMRQDSAQSDTRTHNDVSDSNEEATRFDLDLTPNMTSLLPHGTTPARKSKHIFAQTCLTRLPRSSIGMQSTSQVPDREDMLRRRYNDETVIDRFHVPLAFPVLDTMPQTLFSFPNEEGDASPGSLQICCGLSSSASTKGTLLELRDIVLRHHRAVAVDEREELYNDLTEMGEKFTRGWESDESEGED